MTNIENSINENLNTDNMHLLTSENFNLLRESQKRIREETGFFPSIYMLINKILNQDAVENLTKRMIEIWNTENI